MCVSDGRPLATTIKKKTFPALLTLTIGTSRFKVAVLNITRCPENPLKDHLTVSLTTLINVCTLLCY